MNQDYSILRRVSWGVFFISASILFFELSLIRLFSVVLFPSLAFFAITLVFFGLTISGLIIYFWPAFFNNENFRQKLNILAYLFSASLFSFVFIFLNTNPAISSSETFKLIWYSVLPIVIGNLYLIYTFNMFSSRMGRLYSFDLIGAGIGIIFCLILLSYFSPIGIIIISGFLTLLAVAILTTGKRQLLTLGAIFTVLLMYFISLGGFPDIKYSKRGLEKDVIFSKWNSFSRISLKDENTEKRTLLSLPESYSQKVKQTGIEIDADAYTSVLNFNGNFSEVDFLKNDLSSLAYHIVTPGNSLIIGPGGGRDVLMALLFKNKVTGAEINPIIVNDLMKDRLREYSGSLYLRPDVIINIAEGRSFIKKDTNKYNSINLPLVDTWASTVAGNLAIVEGYLYTVEAIEEYIQHLDDDGILTISRWSVDGAKLVSIFLSASEELGINKPAEHIVIVGKHINDIGLYNYMFKKSPFTARDLAIIKKFTEKNGFSEIYIPGKIIANDTNLLINSRDWREFVKNYPTNISPSTDNKPFFFFTLPISQLYKFSFVNTYLPDGGLGTALKFSIVFTIICMALPFIFTRQKIKGFSINAVLFLFYFGLLGVSFMLIEISLIQKFVLYLEYPIYSYSVVIATILIMAGIGSYFTDRFKLNEKPPVQLLGIMMLFFLIFLTLSGSLIDSTMGSSIIYKILISIALSGPLAFFMGIMMPLGIKKLDSSSMGHLIPWCWAVNGSASILASVGAVLLALTFGFSAVISLGALGYILAFICIYLINLSIKKAGSI